MVTLTVNLASTKGQLAHLVCRVREDAPGGDVAAMQEKVVVRSNVVVAGQRRHRLVAGRDVERWCGEPQPAASSTQHAASSKQQSCSGRG
jgi:hypothetical protein